MPPLRPAYVGARRPIAQLPSGGAQAPVGVHGHWGGAAGSGVLGRLARECEAVWSCRRLRRVMKRG